MSQYLHQLRLPKLAHDNFNFPPLKYALSEPNGLLAYGGDLTAQRLISAYTQGIFPWFNKNEPPMWWSPNPRAIIQTKHIRINRTLRKALKKSPYKITLNTNFKQVNHLCANAPFRNEATWIIPEMQAAYVNLHKLGYAHSIEVWQDNEIVGGLYGVAINGFFSGESMFYKKSNASKVALIALSQLLDKLSVEFIDCQLLNPFLQDMGAIEISRSDFITLKQAAITKEVAKNFWRARELDME